MGSEEAEAVEAKMGLFSVSPKMIKCPEEPSGMLTPPLQGWSAAVPFGWEEEPGKPRPCTALVITAAQLELPPRLATTLLGGPYMRKRPKAASFRLPMPTPRAEDNSYGFSPSPSPQRSSARLRIVSKEKGWLFRKSELKGKARSEVAAGDSFVFPCDDQGRPVEWITRTCSSALGQTKSRFWATIYGGLKQVIPWKAMKLKKSGFVN